MPKSGSDIKKEILLTIAKHGDFSSVKRKFPDLSDSFIKDTLIKASHCFDKDKVSKSGKKAPLKVNTSLSVYTDGASKGNPGISSAGVAIKDDKGNNVALIKKYLGVMTNNKAEYNALIIGLLEALKINQKPVKVFMDSELIVKQIKGEYKVKNEELKTLHKKVMLLLKRFDSYSVKHIMRSKNSLADSLANEAIKEHMSSE